LNLFAQAHSENSGEKGVFVNVLSESWNFL
jgi:hypothetical protein